MKKFARFLILALMLSALLCVTAFAEDVAPFEQIANGATFTMDAGGEKFNVTYTGTVSSKQYLILMVAQDSEGKYTINDTSIQYVNQDAATDAGISFTVYPKEMVDAQIILAGGDEPVALGYLKMPKPDGVKVSGTVTSFLEGDTTVKLMKDGTAVQSATVSTTTGTYEFNSVPVGTYTLEISKVAHATREYEITVGTEDVVQDVTIYLYGDINGDGQVLPNDKTILARYLAEWSGYETLPVYEAVADLNCDGEILPNDKTILARYLAEWTGYETLPKQ